MISANDNYTPRSKPLDVMARVLDTVLLSDADKRELDALYAEMLDESNKRSAA